jgi:hypothetical protein
MNLKETGYEYKDCIHMGHHSGPWPDLAKTVMSLAVSHKGRKFQDLINDY